MIDDDESLRRWRLAKAVRARRLELGLTQETAAARSGEKVSRATWQKVEQGGDAGYSLRVRTGVCATLGWTSTSWALAMDGFDPQLAAEVSVSEVVDVIRADDRLSWRAQQLLVELYELLVRSGS